MLYDGGQFGCRVMDELDSQRFPESFGFRSGARGVHTSRTIMFAELHDLLAALPASCEHSTLSAPAASSGWPPCSPCVVPCFRKASKAAWAA